MSMERRQRPRSERAHIRAEKAKVRRNFAPSGDQLTATELKAQTRLTALTQQTVNEIELWFNQENQPELKAEFTRLKQDLGDISAEDYQESVDLGRFMARYLTANPFLDKALDFVERIWLRRALNYTDQDQFRRELGTFLDACPETLKETLDIFPLGGLTPLQQVKNRVFNPITGALDVRSA